MKNFRLSGFLALFTVCSILISCSTLKNIFNEPTVSFHDVKINKIDFSNINLDFLFAVDNPNSISLNVKEFEYDLIIENSSFLKGKSDKPLNISAEGKSIVPIPLTLNYNDIYDIYSAFSNKDQLNYTINTIFTFDLPVFGSKAFPVKHEGTFPVLKMPEVTFESFKALSITPFSAVLELSVNIINKNSFAISPDSFNFDFTVNKSQWMKGIIKNIEEMAPGKSTTVKIPVEINPSKVGKELFEFIFKGKGLDLVLDGNVLLRTAYPGFGSADVPFRIEKSTAVSK